jgi:hypothetical protein
MIPFGSPDHFPAFFLCIGKRFLAENVFACVKAFYGHWTVEMVRKHDQCGVDHGERFAVIGRDQRLSGKQIGHRLGTFPFQIDEGGDFDSIPDSFET